MKKRILKMLSVMSAVLCLSLCFCFSASAADNEATYTLDSANYSQGKLMDGIMAVQSSNRGIITLNTDCNLTRTMTFSTGDCIIDLDGHSITVDICGIVIENGATIHLKDSKGTGSIYLKSTDSDCFIFDVKGTLEIQSGKLAALANGSDNEAVSVKSSGTLIIGLKETETVSEIESVNVEGGKLELIGTKGKPHKIGKLTVSENAEVQLDCAVNSGDAEITSLVKPGYKSAAELSVVDVSEKAKTSSAAGTYKGHTKTAAEVMGTDSDGIENETLYIALVIAAAVILIAAAIVLTLIILKKNKAVPIK